MRITGVEVKGIGGLVDGAVSFPESPVVAFAGPNGTGKTKLLECLLSLWSNQPPAGRGEEASEVRVEVSFAQHERTAFAELSRVTGWGEVEVPDAATCSTRREPMVGVRRSADPDITALHEGFQMQAFLQSETSLDVVYLPAERRLLPAGRGGIDLNELSDLISWQKTAESRTAAQNYGRLDDQEFEQFAKALCVASTLPDEAGASSSDRQASRVQWDTFLKSINGLLAPKELLPLTRQYPDALRIRTPEGHTHPVPNLSSGERQALIVVSRVFRAGSANRVVIIDEPDAYLHPQLSNRLISALEQAVGDGQLILATHSPSILDHLSPDSIVRMGHGTPPRRVADEEERVDLYRSAGFRASALTQSDLLLVTEGEADSTLLQHQFPQLSRAAVRAAGGRQLVLREVEQLHPYELPVLGTVDADLLASDPPVEIESLIVVWPTADIEGAYLSDDRALEAMLELGLLKAELDSVDAIRSQLTELCEGQRENVIAELAQRLLRRGEEHWPSPRGEQPVERLRQAAAELNPPTQDEINNAISEAERLWVHHDTDRWRLVRGKYVLNAFASQASEMRSGAALLEAVARREPELTAFSNLEARLEEYLGA